jgi:hypothetical protein
MEIYLLNWMEVVLPLMVVNRCKSYQTQFKLFFFVFPVAVVGVGFTVESLSNSFNNGFNLHFTLDGNNNVGMYPLPWNYDKGKDFSVAFIGYINLQWI